LRHILIGLQHLAAPVSLSFKDPVPVIRGAVVGTQTLLNSALKNGKDLSSMVIMSSIVAITSPRGPGHVYSEKDWNETSEVEVAQHGAKAASIDIYAASKTAAEKAFWKFRDDNQPKFAMAAVNPALVGGPMLVLPENPDKINETVIHIYKILAGQPIPPTIGTGTMVDVRDVARLLVFSVDHPEKTNGERFLAASACGPNQAVADILREKYPERRSVIQEGTPGLGYTDYDISSFLDTSKAVKTTGVPFIGFKESVLAAAKAFEQYL
jgi:nucleoside-diphosphate-sugar epimerase